LTEREDFYGNREVFGMDFKVREEKEGEKRGAGAT
jgi:hypothetical protein